jgi:hypothetical protein
MSAYKHLGNRHGPFGPLTACFFLTGVKPMRRISCSGIEYPHFVQRVFSDARTLSRLILCFLGTGVWIIYAGS